MNKSQEVLTAPRGPLALLVHPSNHRSTTMRADEVTHILYYFENRPNAPRLSRIYKRRRAKTDEDPEGDQPSTNNPDGSTLYHPSQGEFTLFFFCEMNCRNSQRITMILTNFVSTANKGNDENKIIQLICVPNDENINLSRTGGSSADILSHLSSQIDYWLLGYDHVNRLAIIRMLSVAVVPSIVVVNNKTGRIVTSLGVDAVENASDDGSGCKQLLDLWRNGKSGVPIYSKLTNCVVS